MVKVQESQDKNQPETQPKIDKRTQRPLKVSLADFVRHTEEFLLECEQNGKVPFLVGLALKCGIDKDTLYGYRENAQYAKYIKKVQNVSENRLLDLVANAKGASINQIFLLKAAHGYTETNKTDITSNGKPLGVVILPQRNK